MIVRGNETQVSRDLAGHEYSTCIGLDIMVRSVHGISEFVGAELIREAKPGFDVKYAKTPGLLTDIRIMPVTVAKVSRRKSVYDKRYSQTEYSQRR